MSPPPPRDEPMLSAGVAAHLRSTPPSGECPDAETLAVYAERTSLVDERAAVEAHVASCLRCQAHLAVLVRSEPPDTAARPFTFPWRWVVPIASAALVILAVFVTRPTPAPETRVDEEVAQAPSAPPPVPQLEVAPPPPPVANTAPEIERRANQAPSALAEALRRESDRSATASRDRRTEKTEEQAKRQETAAGAQLADRNPPAPPPPAASAPQAAAGTTPRERAALDDLKAFASPSTWRLVGGGVERTTDGGKTWATSFRSQGVALRAIAGPLPTVCWAVGDDGAVFRTVDGVTWSQISFPERVPLGSVESTDADHAVVTAGDGRRFATQDGGLTWHPSSQSW